MFEPNPWIQRRACSRSWAVAPVLQYFRALRGVFRHHQRKKKKKSEENEAVEKNFGMGFPVFGKNVKSIMMSPPVVLQMGDGACWAHSQPVLKKLVCDTPTPWFPFVVVKPNKGP